MLVAATGAFAWHGGFSSASTTSATFTATTVGNSQSATCTAANNDSIQITDGTFTGTATSTTDTHLNGPITIFAKSVFDATTKAGTVSGFVMIGTGSSGFEGRLITVNNNGTLQGLLVGEENGVGDMIGNVSAAFTTTGGFASGSVGTGTGTNSAIVSTSSCQPTFNHEGDQGGDQGGGHGFFGHFEGGGGFTNFGRGFNSLFQQGEDH